MAYRNTPQTTTGQTPGELHPLRTRLSNVKPGVDERVQKKQERQKKNYDCKAKDRYFKVGDKVYVKNYRPRPTWVAGEILKKQGSVLFEVKVLNGMAWRRHVNQIRRRTSVHEEPWSDQESEENSQSLLGFPIDVPANVPLQSPVSVGPTTQGTTTVRHSTRVQQPPNLLLPGYTF